MKLGIVWLQPDAATGVDAPVTASLDGRAGVTARPTLLPPSWQWSASDGAGTDINTTAIILAEAHPPSTLEALTIASVIFIACVAIIMSNILIIATFVNFRGELASTSQILYYNFSVITTCVLRSMQYKKILSNFLFIGKICQKISKMYSYDSSWKVSQDRTFIFKCKWRSLKKYINYPH